MSAEKSDASLSHAARETLADLWNLTATEPSRTVSVPDVVASALSRSINSNTKTYRYVLPTQLLAKMVRSELDCRALQKGCDLDEAFDARSLCHEVIVPFDRANNSVLGGSAEPYVSKPVRHPAVTPEFRGSQKNKSGWDDLMCVLDYAQEHPGQVKDLFLLLLQEVRERLKATRITYPAPNRPSLVATLGAIREFLATRSGGLRMQTLSKVLFIRIGEVFGLYSGVVSSDVNAADAATGKVADLECIDSDGNIVLAVEVKDRELTLVQVQNKLPAIRARGVRELLFVVDGGVEDSDSQAIQGLVDQQFAGGHNLYVLEWDPFLESCLVLFGEQERRVMLIEIGEELDESRADLRHRTAWRELLEAM